MLKQGIKILKAALPAILLQWLVLIFIVPIESVLGWAMIVLIWAFAVIWVIDDKEG